MSKITATLFLLFASVSLSYGMGFLPPSTDALWLPFHFDGKDFQSGTGSEGDVVMTRDGYLPYLRTEGKVAREEKLPGGTVAVAGLCYMQVAGGKLKNGSGHAPMAGVTVLLRGTGKQIATETGADGFFAIVVPPGEYELLAAGLTRKVRVEKGKMNLIAIRGGKRMVD